MGNHRPVSIAVGPAYEKATSIDACLDCGLIMTQYTDKLSCPPWSSAGEGDTKTNRAHEAGEVENLKDICRKVQASLVLAVDEQQAEMLSSAYESLERLIRKHEASK